MKKTQSQKHFLGLAGEYAVCTELAKNEINATLTLGNHKAVDIIATNPINNKACFIQVKASDSTRIVTGFFQKYKTEETPHPDFWIIVHFGKDNITDFYVLTHSEMAKVQMERNGMTEWREVNGVDNVLLNSLSNFKNKFETITNHLI
jgi:hypothetical protein